MADLTIVSNEQYASELAQAHYNLEPNISKIIELLPLSGGAPNANPVALLEVVSGMPKVAIRPLLFPARVEGAAWYPPVVLIQVTPEQYQKLQTNNTVLKRFGYSMGGIFNRPRKKNEK